MGIDISTLKQSDKGRKVLYSPDESNTDRSEHGTISSWNDHFVFVRYGTGDTAAATEPYHLFFTDSGKDEAIEEGEPFECEIEDGDSTITRKLCASCKKVSVIDVSKCIYCHECTMRLQNWRL